MLLKHSVLQMVSFLPVLFMVIFRGHSTSRRHLHQFSILIPG
ncbi:Hypothetical protein EAG7_00931 [Klebsiella aerogenes]|nr:Hypothetical protein EAG7_00931 [Klebsiella aerogenes]